jgi:hypothetical protein
MKCNNVLNIIDTLGFFIFILQHTENANVPHT